MRTVIDATLALQSMMLPALGLVLIAIGHSQYAAAVQVNMVMGTMMTAYAEGESSQRDLQEEQQHSITRAHQGMNLRWCLPAVCAGPKLSR